MCRSVAIRFPIVVIQNASIITLTINRNFTSFRGRSDALFANSPVFAFLQYTIQVRIGGLLDYSGGSVLQGSLLSMIVLCDRMFLDFAGSAMGNTCNFLRDLRKALFFKSSLFPIPLICMGEISVIRIFVPTSNCRVYMGAFSIEGSMFFRYMTFPFNGKICSLNITSFSDLSVGTCQTLCAVGIIIGTKFQYCGY